MSAAENASARLWVKICGTTSLDDARLAAEAGADAIGFVFAPSPRQVTVAQVAAITAALAQPIEAIGVFVDATIETIAETIAACGLTGVQLHSGGGKVTTELRSRFGSGLRILRVIHFAAGTATQFALTDCDDSADGVLVDSRTATAVGGTGIPFDWASARSLFNSRFPALRMVVAGGLNPENVAEAIRTLSPWGVDVVTGVEARPGVKDPVKVRAFVAAARAVRRDHRHT